MKVTTKTPEPVKPNVVIELTELEARVLHRLVGRVGGMGMGRAITGELFDKLSALGYSADPQIGKAAPTITTGAIRFAEDDK
jgi:hypothetical protein